MLRAAVPHPARHLPNRKPGGSQQILCLVDPAQENILIGRASGPSFKKPGEMGRTETGGRRHFLHGNGPAQIPANEGHSFPHSSVLPFLRFPPQQQTAEQTMNQLGTGRLSKSLPRRAGIRQKVNLPYQGGKSAGSKNPSPASPDPGAKFSGVDTIEQQPAELGPVRRRVLVGTLAVKQGYLARSRQGRLTIQHKAQLPPANADQHQVSPVAIQLCRLRTVVKVVAAVAEITPRPGRIVKQLLRQRRRRKKVPLRGPQHACLRNIHCAHPSPHHLIVSMVHFWMDKSNEKSRLFQKISSSKRIQHPVGRSGRR